MISVTQGVTEMPKLTDNDDMGIENTIVKYNSNDVFGDLK
jgi:hypothetical protein